MNQRRDPPDTVQFKKRKETYLELWEHVVDEVLCLAFGRMVLTRSCVNII
jgi:hypothetical protein